MSQNALEKLFRHESYYLSLPSKGKYYKSGIELSVDGEIGVMPMTAADEIKLKSPDSLFNGEALYQTIASCIPGIKNPKEIPNIDIDALLIAIRIAGGDGTVELTSSCPKCKETSDYTADLNALIRSISAVDFDNIVHINDNVSVELQPQTLENQVKSQVEAFYQFQMQKALNADGDRDQLAEIFDKALASAIALQVEQVASSIVKVTIDEDDNVIVVDNRDHILEWCKNMSSQDHKKISEKIKSIGSVTIEDEIDVTCPHCEHKYVTKIDLNPANFF